MMQGLNHFLYLQFVFEQQSEGSDCVVDSETAEGNFTDPDNHAVSIQQSDQA